MDYTSFAHRLSSLHNRYYRFYVDHNVEYYDEDSAEEIDGCYPEYTDVHRKRDENKMKEFVSDFPMTSKMYFENYETHVTMKIIWDGNIKKLFKNLYLLRGHRSSFAGITYNKVHKDRPYFLVWFN